MRFNVVAVPEETGIEELPFSQTDIKTMKTASCKTSQFYFLDEDNRLSNIL